MKDKEVTLDKFVLETGNKKWWKLTFWCVFFIILLITAFVLSFVFWGVYVPVDSYGIRQIFVAPFKGYSRVLPSRRYVEIPYISKIYVVSKELHTISYNIPFEGVDDPFGSITLKGAIRFGEESSEPSGFVKLSQEISSDPAEWDTFVKDKLVEISKKEFSTREPTNEWHSQDYQVVIDKITDEANKFFKPYSISILGLYIAETSKDVEVVKKISPYRFLNDAKKKYTLLEEEYKTSKMKFDGELSELRYKYKTQGDELINQAKEYQIKKDAEGNLLVTQAMADVEKERKTILSSLSEEQKLLLEKYENNTKEEETQSLILEEVNPKEETKEETEAKSESKEDAQNDEGGAQ